MEAVRDDRPFALRSPASGEPIKTVSARLLWQKILETRLQTGEPYLLFVDAANRALPKHQRELGLAVRQSNLCSEILLPTGRDHRGETRTAVCCLSSVNFETWERVERGSAVRRGRAAVSRQRARRFHRRGAGQHGASASIRRARERSVGLGAMGFHSFLQAAALRSRVRLPRAGICGCSSSCARRPTRRRARSRSSAALVPTRPTRGRLERFSHKLAIAPTASISIICGGTSACIEPIPANIYTHKTLSGSFTVKNRRSRNCWRRKVPIRPRRGARS